MKKIYWQSPNRNIGDELNVDFFERATGHDLESTKPDEGLLGIGSILDYDTAGIRRVHVLGSGTAFENLRIPNIADYRFWFVRGPLTAKALGIDPQLAITDPAVLVPQVYGLAPASIVREGTLFIPHYSSHQSGGWDVICERLGFKYASPTEELAPLCSAIYSANMVITESLHGAIFADACRTPWVLVRTPPMARTPYKWHDWTASIGMQYAPYDLPWLSTRPMDRTTLVGNLVKSKLRDYGLGPRRWNGKISFVSTEKDIDAAGCRLAQIHQTAKPLLTSDELLGSLQSRVSQKLKEFAEYLAS